MSNTLNAYRVPPQMNGRAAQELHRAGIGYINPVQEITRHVAGRKPTVRHVPLLSGYMSAEGKPRDSKYIGRMVGPVDRVEIIRLQKNADRVQRRANAVLLPFKLGDAVLLGEVPAVVAGITGEDCTVAWDMLGKTHAKTIHYTQLRPG